MSAEFGNVVVLGAGRSGTSLVAGLLVDAGFDTGDDLVPAREANPKGFFEDKEVNRINEVLLASAAPRGPWSRIRRLVPIPNAAPAFPARGRRWLAAIPTAWQVETSNEVDARIVDFLGTLSPPFMLKDPRFSYTLAAWRPHLGEWLRSICVFRHPARTVNSMQTEIATAPYLADTHLSAKDLYSVWESHYHYVLDHQIDAGPMLVLHADELLTGEGVPRLSAFVGREVPSTFADPALRRSSPDGDVPASCLDLYHELCRLADVEPGA